MGTLVHSFKDNVGGKTDLAVETILLFLVYVTLGFRLWSRRLQRVQFQLNDYLIIAATFLMTGRYVIEMMLILWTGLGLRAAHVLEVGGPEIFITFRKLLYADDLLWVTLVTVIKLSILHFYIRVFRQPYFVRSAYAVMGLCGLFWIGGFFATALFCVPPQKLWYGDTPGSCGNSSAFYSGCATSDLILDVIVILLPMPVLWNLQMPLARKIALMAIFAIGFVIISITAVRIKYMNDLDLSDPTYNLTQIGIFSAIVPLLGISNANLPVMPPAFKKMFKSSMLDTKRPSKDISGSSSQSNNWRRPEAHGRVKGGHFERLDEPEIPLVPVGRTDTQ